MNIFINAIHKPVAFIVRDFKVATSYRLQFFMQTFSVFFSSTVFFMLSKMIGTEKLPALANYNGDYFSFLIIGIALTDYFTVSSSAFASEIRSSQVIGTLESLLVTPTSITTILLSSYIYKLLYTSLRITIYFLLGTLVFGAQFNLSNVTGILIIFLLLLLSFIGLGLMSAAFIIVLKQGSPISAFISISSGLLGGVMYPVSVLPDWLLPISKLLPITYGLEAIRQLLLNDASIADIYQQILALIIFAMILFSLGVFSILKGVQIAKKEGSLLHY